MSRPLSTNPVLRFLGSYGLACTLLFCMFLLTLLGTLAQVGEGLFAVQKRYFESWYVLQPVGPLSIPLPGGALCMGLLALNLLVGGLVRIRKTAATAGILVVHVGIVVMMVAALVKWRFSEDGFLRLFEGQQSDAWSSWHEWEVAIWDASEKSGVRELLIPQSHFSDLAEGRQRTCTSERLPFRVVLSHYAENSDVLPKGPMWKSYGPEVDGYAVRKLARDPEQEHNMAAVHVEAVRPDGSSERGILWGDARAAWEFEAGGKRYAFSLRKKLHSMPYTIRLDDFRKRDHPGMTMAAAFESDVTQIAGGTERKVLIEMNEPLRDGGLVLFQSSWGPSNAGPDTPLYSVFSVARNPSDQWPLISCIIIAIGLVWAYGRRLVHYIRSQRPARGRGAAAGSTS
jgi:hypothetical protein